MDEGAPSGVIACRFDEVQETRVTRVRVRSWNDAGEQTAIYGVGPTNCCWRRCPSDRCGGCESRSSRPTARRYGRISVSEISLPHRALGTSLVLPQPVTALDRLVMRLDPPRRACVDLGFGRTARRARPGSGRGRSARPDHRGRRCRYWGVAGTVVAVPGGQRGPDCPHLVQGPRSTRSRCWQVTRRSRVSSRSTGTPRPPGSRRAMSSGRSCGRLAGRREAEAHSRSPGRGGRAVTPGVARIKSGDATRVVDLDFRTSFEPFVADGHLKIVFERPVRPGTSQQPMGIADVDVQGLEGLPTAIDLTATTGADCGFGPVVEVDGNPHETAVTGTLDDVRLGLPLTWWVCDGPVGLDGGRHRVTVEPTNRFTPVELVWRPATGPTDALVPPGSDRSLDVREWGSTLRRVDVGAARCAAGGRERERRLAGSAGRASKLRAGDAGRLGAGLSHPRRPGRPGDAHLRPGRDVPRGAPGRWGAGAPARARCGGWAGPGAPPPHRTAAAPVRSGVPHDDFRGLANPGHRGNDAPRPRRSGGVPGVRRVRAAPGASDGPRLGRAADRRFGSGRRAVRWHDRRSTRLPGRCLDRIRVRPAARLGAPAGAGGGAPRPRGMVIPRGVAPGRARPGPELGDRRGRGAHRRAGRRPQPGRAAGSWWWQDDFIHLDSARRTLGLVRGLPGARLPRTPRTGPVRRRLARRTHRPRGRSSRPR